ncbi:uncharacterized protein LOC130986009 isoform X2 [Salvia miltiorrhiza]|uniref:uncharacterized protein LOC130986009 isoform X2 n=1 Tax=Salvia miltiorrhiza TaxID=226208 RepID=UPI0025ABD06F|nr:uncharacterized protein LOC130986009 isoform X2 [Salvia miltiorrhiza]
MAKSAPVLLLSVAPPPSLCRPSPFILSTRFRRRRIHGRRARIRAVREWQDYEEAVKKKDLAGALRFLKLKDELRTSSIESTGQLNDELRMFAVERDFQVLNTCLNADDMRLVGSAYALLKDRGLLPNFGKYRNIVLGESREVTPSLLKSSTGLEVSKLSPKKWGVSGSSSVVLIAVLAGTSILINQGIDIRPNLVAILALSMLDAILLGGACLAQISSYWPPHRRRILVHEAGHLLVAYLMGCPIRGVILDPIRAMQMGIQGQMSNQARWSVLQSYNLLKLHKPAHRAAFIALESGGELSLVIRRIEEAIAMSSN